MILVEHGFLTVQSVLRHLACFFKSPMGCDEHDFFKQMEMLAEYVGAKK